MASIDPIDRNQPGVPASAHRLSIAHMLLWTTMTAICVAIFRSDHQANASMGASYASECERVIVAAFAPIFGASMTMVLVVIHRRVTRGLPSLIQPGHWLLFAMGLVAAPAVTLLASQTILGMTSLVAAFVGVAVMIFTIESVATLLYAAISCDYSMPWRIAFITIGLFLIDSLASAWFIPLHGPGWLAPLLIGLSLASLLAVAIAVISDKTTTMCQYDVFHWLGAAVWPALLILLGLLATYAVSVT